MLKNIRILSFDPGLSKAGWSIIDYKPDAGTLVVNQFGMLSANRLTTHRDLEEEVKRFGKQIIALNALRDMVASLFTEYQPDYVVAEDTFFNPITPSAYAALLQWLNTVALYLYREHQLPLYRISPRSVKLCSAGYGGSGKGNVQEAIIRLNNLKFKQKKYLAGLTEHEADAIAVAYTFVIEMLPSLYNGDSK